MKAQHCAHVAAYYWQLVHKPISYNWDAADTQRSYVLFVAYQEECHVCKEHRGRRTEL